MKVPNWSTSVAESNILMGYLYFDKHININKVSLMK